MRPVGAVVVLSIFLWCMMPAAWGQVEVKVLVKADIEKLTNEQLADIYIEAKIEAEAQKTFYRTGFTHKEYQEYRGILSFIVRLRQEMEKRKMDAPPIEEWLK